LEQLLSVLRTNQIQLPSSTFMLLKTIIMAQGLGRGLDPNFDILPMLESSVRGLITKRYSFQDILSRLSSKGAELANLIGGLPERLDRMMKTAERGEVQLRVDATGIEEHIHHLEGLVNKVIIVIIVAAIIVGLGLFFGLRMGH